MNATDYLNRSALYRKLVYGPYREFAGVYAAKMSNEGLGRQCTWRSLSLFRDLMDWHVGNGHAPQDLNEVHADRFLEHRFKHWKPDSGDRSALRRLLLALREKGLIPAALPIQRSEHEMIVDVFGQYLSNERGLAAATVGSHKLLSLRFLREVCPFGADEFAALTPEIVIGYVERHALDGSADSGKAMCGVVRAFLRYLHLKGFISTPLADCVPSIRRWRLAGLPTFLPPEKVQKVLDACDRTTAMGRRDYAVLMILAKLGLRASEVATLNLDDIDWQSGTILVHGKGRRQATMPLRHDVGTAIVAYIRHGRPASACRRVFLRTLAPHVGFASGCAITMIAKQALERAGIDGYAHHGAHLFRHSLATDLLRSGASFAEIGQLLRHRSIDSTRIYAKLDIEKLRELSLPWPGGVQ
ncbi:tyrosine-type recombinase/integrase [Rhizobium sophorae]|jgi:site-specific recombinase XerD|uniref:Tyrosine-type recombinase/integrase n=3 Tax=Rhizobium TaxID=379 RepID=A0A7Y3WJ46_9HYPH|nr:MULTISPECIES: site-specific integrase [Rhizobium]MBB4390911.1 site-specific recombinase XerD [Rhizobium leguminosarum]NNU41879.1 tyrosine-type recombinase/integrase [Rhizobium sophorae]PCK83163.1 integrase [Rhizobium sophoriradicis]ULJ76799.1 tyrosine-type recombinase/integrase [Rhizobium sp. C104]